MTRLQSRVSRCRLHSLSTKPAVRRLSRQLLRDQRMKLYAHLEVACLYSHGTPKPSMMDTWLSNSCSKSSSGTKRSSDSANTDRKQAAKREPNENRRTSTLSGQMQAVTLPTMDEIDPEVLKELPEELRASLMKDIGRAHPSKRKENSIRTLLLPQRRRQNVSIPTKSIYQKEITLFLRPEDILAYSKFSTIESHSSAKALNAPACITPNTSKVPRAASFLLPLRWPVR